jgi:hypothetical protein
LGEILYLETTAAIDATFKSFPELLALIKSSEKPLSSHYVKMEIKKGFLYNLVLLHNKAVECDSFSQVQQFVSNLASSPRRYYLGAVLDASKVYWQNYENNRPDDLKAKYGNIPMGDIQRRETINFLRIWIRMLLPRIDKMVGEVMNPMKCFVDLKGPELKDDLFDNRPAKCPASTTECEIHRFFEKNIKDFDAILARLRALPDNERDPETLKRMAALNRIIKKRVRRAVSGLIFSNKSQDEQLCWACGDAIHAVLAPKGSSVVNRNGRHYDPICESIGRKSLVYTSPKV